MPFDRRGAVPFVAGENRHGRESRGFHARRRTDPLQQFAIELDRPRCSSYPLSAGDSWNVSRLSIATPVSVVLQVLQTADEEPRAEQQEKAERNLRRDETLAQEQRAASAGN